jgi:4-oxalocrotonate tautomerase
MPVVTIQVPARSLALEQKEKMIRLVTDAIVEAEGFAAVRPSVHVLIEETPDGGYGVGGRAIDVDAVKAALSKRG